jgi:hypothetical protein
MLTIAGGIILAVLVLCLLEAGTAGLYRRRRPREPEPPPPLSPEQIAYYADPNNPIRVMARRHKAERLAREREAAKPRGWRSITDPRSVEDLLR